LSLAARVTLQEDLEKHTVNFFLPFALTMRIFYYLLLAAPLVLAQTPPDSTDPATQPDSPTPEPTIPEAPMPGGPCEADGDCVSDRT
jgi:hypothetical protein